MTTREEIGPWLGVVASPRPRLAPGGVELDDLRLALVDRILAEGRSETGAWLDAWQEASAGAVTRTLALIGEMAAAAARRSRAPARVTAVARPDPDDRRMIQARIDSAGMPLEEAVSVSAPVSRLGGALEESLLELERQVGSVMSEWLPRIGALEAWRRPVGPLWVATAAVAGLALLLGLMVGGYVPAPGWLQPFTSWWWSLPWP